MKTQLSTKEVAALLNITETTVKRWADIGKLKCSKTLGGHRKFDLHDVIKFAEDNSFPISGVIPPPLSKKQLQNLEFSVYTKNYPLISDILKTEALQGDKEGIEKLLQYLYKNNIKFTTIVDEIIQPALSRIGELWQNKSINIDQEHLSSTAVKEALIRTSSILFRKPYNKLKSLCACVEGEIHDIGITTISYCLEIEGFKVINLGIDTPFKSIKNYIENNKPNVVCLSATSPDIEKDYFINAVRDIANLVHSYKGKIICGGIYSNLFEKEELQVDLIAYSTTDTIDFVKEVFKLKPGKKKHNNKNINKKTITKT